MNSVQSVLAFLEGLEERSIAGETNYLRVLYYLRHHGLPLRVDIPKVSGLDRKMLLDIRRRENGLKIQPHRLHLDPILREVKRIQQPLLPILNLSLKYLRIRTALHGLCLHDLIIQNLLHLINRSTGYNKRASVSPLLKFHVDWRPIVLHLSDDLLNTELLLCVLRDDIQLGDLIEDLIDLDQLADVEVLVGVDWEVCVFADLGPMALFHARVAEDSNERDELEVVLHLVGQPV